MAGPAKQSYGAWRHATGKGGNLSNAERRRRDQQSLKDRRLHRRRNAPASTARESNARSNRQMNIVREPRTLIESKPRNSAELDFNQHLTHICRGLPAPVPTRVEVFTFRARLKLQAGNIQPSVLLHPSTSITAGLIVGANVVSPIQTWRAGEEDASGTFPNWVDSTLQHPGIAAVSIYDAWSLDRSGEAVGHPNAMVSGEGRPLGALMRVRVTAGPTARGYMAHSCPGAAFSVPSMKEGHATNARVPRLDIQHGASRDFYAPLLAPHNVEKFSPANDQFHWSPEDPYGGLLLTFHEVDWALTYDTPPIVDITIIHAVECRLDLEDRHLKTTHQQTTKDQKTKVQGSDKTYGALSGKVRGPIK